MRRESLGLIEKEPKEEDDFDYKCSKKLCSALQSKRRIFRKVILSKWISHFRKLRIDDEVKKSDIREILEWYVHHIGNEGVPEAYSAASFRERFDQIAAAMNRHKKENWPIVKTKGELTEIDYG